jgi:hypothetical protein
MLAKVKKTKKKTLDRIKDCESSFLLCQWPFVDDYNMGVSF